MLVQEYNSYEKVMSIAENIERKSKDSKNTQTVNNVERTPTIIPKETWSSSSNKINTRGRSRDRYNSRDRTRDRYSTRRRSDSTNNNGEQNHYDSQRYRDYSRERTRDRYLPRGRSRSISGYRKRRRDQTPGTEKCNVHKATGTVVRSVQIIEEDKWYVTIARNQVTLHAIAEHVI
jgi:hypothetical protein